MIIGVRRRENVEGGDCGIAPCLDNDFDQLGGCAWTINFLSPETHAAFESSSDLRISPY